jgi:hypothetical protein
MNADRIAAALDTLTRSGAIYASRIDDDKVVVSLDVVYAGPACDYDAETAARVSEIDAALEAVGLHFSDAGGEEDRQAEYFIYRAD